LAGLACQTRPARKMTKNTKPPAGEHTEAFADADNNLWLLLQQTRDTIATARGKELGKYGLSNIESALLFAISAIYADGSQQATPTEISRWLFRKPHSISALVRRMEKKGLVTCTHDLGKKNLVRIALTDEGRKAYRQSTKRVSIRKALSSLSEEERRQLWSCLKVLRDATLKQLGRKEESPFLQLR